MTDPAAIEITTYVIDADRHNLHGVKWFTGLMNTSPTTPLMLVADVRVPSGEEVTSIPAEFTIPPRATVWLGWQRDAACYGVGVYQSLDPVEVPDPSAEPGRVIKIRPEPFDTAQHQQLQLVLDTDDDATAEVCGWYTWYSDVPFNKMVGKASLLADAD